MVINFEVISSHVSTRCCIVLQILAFNTLFFIKNKKKLISIYKYYKKYNQVNQVVV